MSKRGLNLLFLLIIIISIIFNIAGCGDDVLLPADKVSELLQHKGYSIERMEISLRHPYAQRPWICLAKRSQEEFFIVIWPSEKMDITQLGVGGKLTWDRA
ncbi:hypothetical protein REC12_06240 [Desulfosporosinus sp. PR]|uniref:hypothetical protein n=1 Tax=Candidatus Desulfosporosinus nitrosoreducens TaxID=3401928 RepID=UPI0027ED32E1|nr:hypothetical protein [Desulfosporosinus sp. PR]MDQ7093184.1 hypothetical protein [Desulfosporosinus sp. PR]